jgi:hypothetical protein
MLTDLSLWPTKIRTGQLNLRPELNAELARIVKDYDVRHMQRYESGFKHNVTQNIYTHEPSAAIDEYFGIMKEMFETYVFEVAGLTPAHITKPSFNCFGSLERRGQWSEPHTHHGNQVVVTYYPEVVRMPDEPHPYAGSIVFHTPTPSQSGFWARSVPSFHPIKVESGTIVIFPGNAEHSTNPFFCEGSYKCALVSNVRFAGSLEGDDPRRTYQYESEIEDARDALRNQQ